MEELSLFQVVFQLLNGAIQFAHFFLRELSNNFSILKKAVNREWEGSEQVYGRPCTIYAHVDLDH